MVDYLIFGSLFVIAIVCFIHHETRFKNVNMYESSYHRELAKCESYLERMVFKTLWHHGYDVQTQVEVGSYRVDMCIGNIAIECDGAEFHDMPAQKAKDKNKNTFLRACGYRVLRFSGNQIYTNLDSVVRRVNNEIKKAQSI